MARYSFILLALVSFLFLEASGQDYLLLRKSTRSARIKEDTRVRLKLTGQDSLVEGKLDQVLDSVIIVDGDSIRVSAIQSIGIKRTSFGPWLIRELGEKLPPAGLLYLLLGTANSLIFDYPPVFSWYRTAIAAAISGTGFILKGVTHFIQYKTYSTGKWQIRTMTFDL